ncbi:MAG TPA: TonB-dependent receptor [Pyrinomonadaceae bacterium]
MRNKSILLLFVFASTNVFHNAFAQPADNGLATASSRTSVTSLSAAQEKGKARTGTIRGAVTIQPSGTKARNAIVTITELRRSVATDENGVFEFGDVPTGSYEIIAHLDRVPDVVKTVEIRGGDQTLDFELTLAPVSERVTVTASGFAESVGSSYQSVNSVSALELAQKNTVSLGEALDNQLGIAKRSFGPGSGRPVVRGFDGDRILVLQDALRTGSIASQSADESEPIDVLALDRIEIVRGPATLLYGSNAIGGVVNAISTNNLFQSGLSGYVTTFAGSGNPNAGGSAGFRFGVGRLMLFANGGAQRTSDYDTPLGKIRNSYARGGNASGGAGWFPRRGWLSFNYSFDGRRHGLPVEPDELDLEFLKERRHSFDFKGGLRDLNGFVRNIDFGVRQNNYKVREFEFETDENVTELESLATNRNFNYFANFDHRRHGKSSGTFGFSGFTRDYESIGEEAPAPHTKQNSFAAYALERMDFERVGFQFGGRVEQNSYKPEGDFRHRNFIGFSGSAGARVRLWNDGVFVANYQHSFRAPALEELYNNGPHPGIQVFDIGNENLRPERGDGVDLSLRHNSRRVRFEIGTFYYNFRNFVFTAFTGLSDVDSGLSIVNYEQGRARYIGAETAIESEVLPSLWLNGKVDYTRATLTEFNKPLPRIPPVRSSVGLDWRHKAFSLRPEVVMINRQARIFDNETPTAGYAVFNLSASYTFVTKRAAHFIAVNGYNLGDTPYRNHLSFIKEIAPEIGRNVRLSYTMRF